MQKKEFSLKVFVFLSVIVFVVSFMISNPGYAQDSFSCTGYANQYGMFGVQGGKMYGTQNIESNVMNRFGYGTQGSDYGNRFRYNVGEGSALGGSYAQKGSAGPRWFTDPDSFSGQGPSWFLNPQEGVGPWFWQAYNGYDVSAIAPTWYIDSTTADYIPPWYADGTIGPWWSTYIQE